MVGKLTLVGDLGSPPRNSINMLETSNEETEAKSKHIIAHICVLCVKKFFLMRKLGKTLESQSGLMAAEEKAGTLSNSCQLRAKAGDLPEN